MAKSSVPPTALMAGPPQGPPGLPPPPSAPPGMAGPGMPPGMPPGVDLGAAPGGGGLADIMGGQGPGAGFGDSGAIIPMLLQALLAIITQGQQQQNDPTAGIRSVLGPPTGRLKPPSQGPMKNDDAIGGGGNDGAVQIGSLS